MYSEVKWFREWDAFNTGHVDCHPYVPLASAASEREAGRKQEREEIVADLSRDRDLLHGWARDGRDAAIDVIRSREPGPTKLEKLDAVEGWGAETMARAFNALVDATTANTEAIARMGGKT